MTSFLCVQVFSLAAMPARWRPAVEVLVRAAALLADGAGKGGPTDDGSRASDLTASCPQESSCSTELPHALGTCALGFEDECRTRGWWSQQTLSLFPDDKDDTIVMEWTPQASLSKPSGPNKHCSVTVGH